MNGFGAILEGEHRFYETELATVKSIAAQRQVYFSFPGEKRNLENRSGIELQSSNAGRQSLLMVRKRKFLHIHFKRRYVKPLIFALTSTIRSPFMKQTPFTSKHIELGAKMAELQDTYADQL
jgi:hypothetical protein